jgi:DDE superfamily endonuclease/Transposase
MEVIRNRDGPFQWDPFAGIPPFAPPCAIPQLRHQTTRDQRRDIKLSFRLGFEPEIIAKQQRLTVRQVKYALAQPATPKKKVGRPHKLNHEQIDELVEFVCASKAGRQMTYYQLAQHFRNSIHHGWNIQKDAIRTALEKRGFHRRVAMAKPLISEKNCKLRLAFALERQYWTVEQWLLYLWTDETWVTDGRHKRTFVTRRPGEEWDENCVVVKLQRKKGWMFWGSFHGITRGPAFFWEKDWGTISGPTYRTHTVPILADYLWRNPGLVLMQDNAPAHAARETLDMLCEFEVDCLDWPPYSPDLNPIETVWKDMKEYLTQVYSDCVFKSYDESRRKVWEAWEYVVTPSYLEQQIKTMPERMQAVIDAKGKFTRY